MGPWHNGKRVAFSLFPQRITQCTHGKKTSDKPPPRDALQLYLVHAAQNRHGHQKQLSRPRGARRDTARKCSLLLSGVLGQKRDSGKKSENISMKYGLQVNTNVIRVQSLAMTKEPHEYSMLLVGETGWEHTGSLHYLGNNSINLKIYQKFIIII